MVRLYNDDASPLTECISSTVDGEVNRRLKPVRARCEEYVAGVGPVDGVV